VLSLSTAEAPLQQENFQLGGQVQVSIQWQISGTLESGHLVLAYVQLRVYFEHVSTHYDFYIIFIYLIATTTKKERFCSSISKFREI